MSDEAFSAGRKVYRRRRRHQGASFSSLYTGAELKEDGPWCRRCKQRHGYMVCKIAYDFDRDPIRLRWLCPNFGHDIGELILAKGDSSTEESGTGSTSGEDRKTEGTPEEAGEPEEG